MRMTGREAAVLGLLAAIWGASFFLIKIALHDFSPILIAGFRVLLAAVFLLALASRGSQGGLQQNWTAGQWKKFLILAVFNAVIPYILIAWGEQHISSGLAAIFNATTPLFAFLYGYLLPGSASKENLGIGGLIGLLVGIAGVGLLVGGAGGGDLAGEVAVVVASASYAVAGHFARRAFQGQPVLVPALGQNVFAALLLVPVGLIFTWPAHWPNGEVVAAVLALGLGGTGLAYVLYYWLIANAGPTRTLTVTYLLPVTALIYGALLLGETIVWREVAGMLLILLGIAGTSGLLRRTARTDSVLDIEEEVLASESP
jgi:drug/metabolite transporter (DMT)-like permease